MKSLVNSSSALSCQLAENLNFSNFGFAHKQTEIWEKRPHFKNRFNLKTKTILFAISLLVVFGMRVVVIKLNFSTFWRNKDASIVRLFVFRSNLNKWCCFCVIWFAAMAPFFCCFGRISYGRIDGNSKGVTLYNQEQYTILEKKNEIRKIETIIIHRILYDSIWITNSLS